MGTGTGWEDGCDFYNRLLWWESSGRMIRGREKEARFARLVFSMLLSWSILDFAA